MAVIVLAVSLPIMALLIRNDPAAVSVEESDNVVVEPDGLSLRQAAKTREFWVILLCIFVVATVFNAMLPTMVPLLTDRAMPVEQAVFAVTVMGIAMAISRVVVGYLIDHIFAPYVATAIFIVASGGLAMLALGAVGSSAYVAAFLIGLGFGAETDLMGFLVTRYFGLKNFGQIYGVVLAAFLVGTGLGPYVLNVAYEQIGNYQQALAVATVLGVVSAVAFLLLRAYPGRFEHDVTSADLAAESA